MIRHAQLLGNLQQHRTPDDGLSPLGYQQADLIPAAFAGVPVSVIFCSPFRRTIETATPLARAQGLRLTLVPELSEIFDAEARRDHPWAPVSQIEANNPLVGFVPRQRRGDQWWPAWPEREEVEVRQRVQRFYDADIAPLIGTDAHVVVVGHGATVGQLKALLDHGAAGGGHANAVIRAYELDRECKVLSVRVITEHLAPLDQP
ncbi:MAG TPA: histidine phosphatase family protein [Symbiobacteriaceae bacterium]|nr:histidine phosphatase family protein [Symbiobacteriaceae bacterium]